MNGMITIYKEKGYTSHDVVACLRGILGQKKIGHTGTLDPDAEGVLPVCLGKGTRLCNMLTDWDKTYETVLLFGVTTDTQDISGEVLRTVEPESFTAKLTRENILAVLERFTGEQLQVPPMYSAKKVGGKKLYELARKGVVVERKPAHVRIDRIELLKLEPPHLSLRVHCSKGVYIRTLCNDIGDALGMGGCMESLTRTAVGPLVIDDAYRLSDVEKLRDDGKLDACVVPVDRVLVRYPALILREDWGKSVQNGSPFPRDAIREVGGHSLPQDEPIETYREPMRVYTHDSQFIGLFGYRDEKEDYAPIRMFWESASPGTAQRESASRGNSNEENT